MHCKSSNFRARWAGEQQDVSHRAGCSGSAVKVYYRAGLCRNRYYKRNPNARMSSCAVKMHAVIFGIQHTLYVCGHVLKP